RRAPESSAPGVAPGIAHQRPVVDTVRGGHRSGGRGLGAALAGREPHELARGGAAGPRGLDLRAVGAALAALRPARALRVLLGLALIFLAATVAAVHRRSLLRHSAPFVCPLPFTLHERPRLRASCGGRARPPRLVCPDP